MVARFFGKLAASAIDRLWNASGILDLPVFAGDDSGRQAN